MWGPPDADQPGSFAFRVYRNYDGMGGSFGETSVKAESEDSDKIGVLRREKRAGTNGGRHQQGGRRSQYPSFAEWDYERAAGAGVAI